jgi:uncharacterized SAM-binding protein YcdF (DUF218 family)
VQNTNEFTSEFSLTSTSKVYQILHKTSLVIVRLFTTTTVLIVEKTFAMKQYLLNKERTDEGVLIEDNSTNTLQSMLFSKRIMYELKQEHKNIFVTNNYHVSRASIYARIANLTCEGGRFTNSNVLLTERVPPRVYGYFSIV